MKKHQNPFVLFVVIVVIGFSAIYYDQGNDVTIFQTFTVLTLAWLAESLAKIDNAI